MCLWHRINATAPAGTDTKMRLPMGEKVLTKRNLSSGLKMEIQPDQTSEL